MKFTKNEKAVIIRMDKNLWSQLYKYSRMNDLSFAQSARLAIKRFIKEEKSFKGKAA
jgi:hypothetical protein